MSKHTPENCTPGEWKQRGFRVYTGELDEGITRAIADFNIARIRNTGGRMTSAEFGEAEANLALFLAAPELLAACKAMLPHVEHAEKCEASADDGYGPTLKRLREICNAARAAIKKAEGS